MDGTKRTNLLAIMKEARELVLHEKKINVKPKVRESIASIDEYKSKQIDLDLVRAALDKPDVFLAVKFETRKLIADHKYRNHVRN